MLSWWCFLGFFFLVVGIVALLITFFGHSLTNGMFAGVTGQVVVICTINDELYPSIEVCHENKTPGFGG